MLNLGTVQTLTILKRTDFGVYLYHPSGSKEERVLLPKKEVPIISFSSFFIFCANPPNRVRTLNFFW